MASSSMLACPSEEMCRRGSNPEGAKISTTSDEVKRRSNQYRGGNDMGNSNLGAALKIYLVIK